MKNNHNKRLSSSLPVIERVKCLFIVFIITIACQGLQLSNITLK